MKRRKWKNAMRREWLRVERKAKQLNGEHLRWVKYDENGVVRCTPHDQDEEKKR